MSNKHFWKRLKTFDFSPTRPAELFAFFNAGLMSKTVTGRGSRRYRVKPEKVFRSIVETRNENIRKIRTHPKAVSGVVRILYVIRRRRRRRCLHGETRWNVRKASTHARGTRRVLPRSWHSILLSVSREELSYPMHWLCAYRVTGMKSR